MMLAAAAEELRGGILLVISILLVIFFFVECFKVIIGGKNGTSPVRDDSIQIRCKVSYKGDYRGNVLIGVSRERNMFAGMGKGEDYDLNLSDYLLPDEAADPSLYGPWFSVGMNQAGVLMVTADNTMEGLKVRNGDEAHLSPLKKKMLKGELIIARGEIEITLREEL